MGQFHICKSRFVAGRSGTSRCWVGGILRLGIFRAYACLLAFHRTGGQAKAEAEVPVANARKAPERIAERQTSAVLPQEPPRRTRCA
ncbi:MAG: hypothetical protein AAF329_17155 [Cyanobacteria bacterium P01_A01_bin.17]